MYRFTDIFNFTPLNNYNNLVLQLYSVEKYDTIILKDNESFRITNENDWYDCTNMKTDFNLQMFNLVISKTKPFQHLNSNLKYKIIGDATIQKNKYLKVGKEISTIIVSGFKENVVNYIAEFQINSITVNFKYLFFITRSIIQLLFNFNWVP